MQASTPAMFNSRGPGKPHWVEYVVRIALFGGLLFGAAKLINFVAPTLISAITNIYILIGLGLPLAFFLWWAVSNKGLLWMTFKNLSRKLTQLFVKIDFLSYIDSYIEILDEKLANLRQNKTTLLGRYKAFKTNIETVEAEAENNLNLAKAAKKLGRQQETEYHASLANTSKQSYERLLPVATRMEKNLQLLDKLEENWEMSIGKLRHEVKTRRAEYEHMREVAKTLGNVEAFMRGDSEEAKIFYASLNELDNNLADKVARIEEFEKRSKNMMNQIDLEKQMNADEGMLLLDQFEQHGSEIFLPADYSKDAINVQAQVISSQPLKSKQFGNLLKK